MSHLLHTTDLAPYGITSDAPPTHSLDLNGVQIHPLMEPWELTDLDKAMLKVQLNNLAERVRYHVRKTSSGSNFTALAELADDWYAAGLQDIRYFVQLKHAMDFIRADNWDSLHHSKQMTILFKLAIDLVHETSPNHPHDIDQDPYWDLSDPRKEVGTAWEAWFFGMQIQPFPNHNVSDINLETASGHAKPVHATLMTHPKASRAGNITPFARSDWYLATSTSVQRFFDIKAWDAFTQSHLWPALVNNPLQLELTPVNFRSVMEMQDGSGMSELVPSQLTVLQDQSYMAFLQNCFMGRYNERYDIFGEFAESSDPDSDAGNPMIYPLPRP